MRCAFVVVIAAALAAGVAAAQNTTSSAPDNSAKSAGARSSAQTAGTPGNGLQKAFESMDRAAATFKSAKTSFVWDQYTEVVNATDEQGGMMFIRKRPNGELQMAADITLPRDAPKYVLYTGGKDAKVQLYQPKIEQVTQYAAGKNKEVFESFLVLGFGGSSSDLKKEFDIAYDGDETLGNGIRTIRLKLVSTRPNVRKMFNPIYLWIDPARGIAVQQKFMQPDSGDYRLAKYSNIELNTAIPDDVFRLKTTGKTKYVSPGF